ncbi:DUF7500 family protein [Halorubrum halodurans]|uniref:Flagella cluster protein n=1 Tax=Halorubrum halodurans TaxID=1383851 RepID=A0A256IQ52_9EURY|nr:hypothetical protein DJ70_02470 [Halorubrum halodurans]
MSDDEIPAAADDNSPPADPTDLDFTDDETVVEIGEDRFVVGTGGRPNLDAQASDAAERRESKTDRPEPESPAGMSDPEDGPPPLGDGSRGGLDDGVDRQAVSRWLAESFDGDGFDYGVDVTLHANGSTARNRMVSNDVTATFDTTLSWFVANAGPGTDPAEALGLLLVAADAPIDLPPMVIKRFAADQGLSANDSIGELIRAAEDAGGFRIE